MKVREKETECLILRIKGQKKRKRIMKCESLSRREKIRKRTSKANKNISDERDRKENL